MKPASHPSHTLWKSLRDYHIPTASTAGYMSFRTQALSVGNRRMLLFVLTFIALLCLTSCTLKGRLYNLDTGEVTPVKMTYSGSGRGTISGTFSNGEAFSGDYVTFLHPPVNWGKIYGTV
jgi:uncharacterized membrane protein